MSSYTWELVHSPMGKQALICIFSHLNHVPTGDIPELMRVRNPKTAEADRIQRQQFINNK